MPLLPPGLWSALTEPSAATSPTCTVSRHALRQCSRAWAAWTVDCAGAARPQAMHTGDATGPCLLPQPGRGCSGSAHSRPALRAFVPALQKFSRNGTWQWTTGSGTVTGSGDGEVGRASRQPAPWPARETRGQPTCSDVGAWALCRKGPPALVVGPSVVQHALPALPLRSSARPSAASAPAARCGWRTATTIGEGGMGSPPWHCC